MFFHTYLLSDRFVYGFGFFKKIYSKLVLALGKAGTIYLLRSVSPPEYIWWFPFTRKIPLTVSTAEGNLTPAPHHALPKAYSIYMVS